MSEFNVVVIQIGKIDKHPNADSLSITQVLGNYPVIFKTGDFKESDLAVYIPIDSIIPDNDPEFAFLGEHRRIKARRLRGIFSMGLLMPLRDQSWEVGRNVQNEYRIIKYESQIPINMQGEQESDPEFMPIYTDIEGLRKWPDIIEEGEEVILTEKIHGTSSRFLYKNNRLWVGSHKTIKKENKDNLYWKVAYQYNLPELLKQYENYIFYGEIYGNVQDLKYGCKLNEYKLIIFDIYSLNLSQYLSWLEFLDFMKQFPELSIPPILYQGPWSKDLLQYAEGLTTIHGANHVREGFVVKPKIERWDNQIGRVILKYIGEGYYLRKEK